MSNPALLAECNDFVRLRQKAAVILAIAEPLGLKHVVNLRRMLAGKAYTELDVIIQSGGGNVNAAYQIIELLRLHSQRLNACVPFMATSAATLLCLGCDMIYLDELAQLGPLDTQILEQKRGGKVEFTSALNPFKTLEQLQKFSVETLDIGVKMIAARSGMDLDECIKHGIEFVGVTIGPLFSKLDPEKLGEYSRALAVGREYAERLIRRYKSWDSDKAKVVVERLVHGYPAHDYIIDYHELQEMGVEVELFGAEESKACMALSGALAREQNVVRLCEVSDTARELGGENGGSASKAETTRVVGKRGKVAKKPVRRARPAA